MRRWVARGYVSPAGRLGPSNLFNTSDVLAAFDDIRARRKATGQARRTCGFFVEPRLIDRIAPRHYDAVVSMGEAARMIAVSPSTIRSWIHRGHLVPLASSKPRAIRVRLGDVIDAARARRLPERSARRGRGGCRPAG
ncbi:MAG: helix-turn-helix domain-containing protein [Pseudonocardiaceae bacterium]